MTPFMVVAPHPPLVKDKQDATEAWMELCVGLTSNPFANSGYRLYEINHPCSRVRRTKWMSLPCSRVRRIK